MAKRVRIGDVLNAIKAQSSGEKSQSNKQTSDGESLVKKRKSKVKHSEVRDESEAKKVSEVLKEMIEPPESKKMKKLEVEMHQVARSETENLAEKSRQYELLLEKYKDAMAKLEQRGTNSWRMIMESGGVLYKDGKVLVPLDAVEQQRQKRSAAVYSEAVFNRAMEYLADAESKKKKRPNEKLLKKIYELLSPHVNVDKYPRLRAVSAESAAKLNGKWCLL